jgi:hypothetical protein
MTNLTKSLAIAAMSIAMLSAPLPVKAIEVGNVIHFRTPVIGCTVFSDAYEAFRLQTLYRYPTAEAFARQVGDPLLSDRWCTIFGERPDNSDEWKVLRTHRTQYTAPTDIWACIVTTVDFDVRPPSEVKSESKSERKGWDCFWVFLDGRGNTSNNPAFRGGERGK